MIIVECYRDQALIYRIGFIPEQVRHAHSKSRALRTLEQQHKAVAVVDEDPHSRQPGLLRSYDEKATEGGIKLLVKEGDDGKKAIQISPRIEDWLYAVARRNRISPEGFGLPDHPEQLHARSVQGDEGFRRFLIELIRKKDDEVSTLREWIREAIIE
jgi:hypothetical protein